MLDWVKRHKILSIVCFIFIVFGVPTIIHCLFKLHPIGKFSFLLLNGAQESYYNIMVVFLRFPEL
jgi:hypothetical protein